MITDLYFIDCENVGMHPDISLDVKTSKIFYFYSKNLSFIKRNSNEIGILVSHNGCKDALDFVLDSYLGFQIRNYGYKVKYHIVSNDKGYINIANFWKEQGYRVYFECINYISIIANYRDTNLSCRRKIYNVFNNWSIYGDRSLSSLKSGLLKISTKDDFFTKDIMIELAENLFNNDCKVVKLVKEMGVA